jgi:hypothetical protein
LITGQPKSWDNAQQFCRNDGGNLASINDAFDQAYISLVKTGSINTEWIGFKNVKTTNSFEIIN